MGALKLIVFKPDNIVNLQRKKQVSGVLPQRKKWKTLERDVNVLCNTTFPTLVYPTKLLDFIIFI